MRVSKGAVRCGSCRERFKASDDSAKIVDKFKLEDPFLEPLTEEKILASIHTFKSDEKLSSFAEQSTSSIESNIDPELSVELNDDGFTEFSEIEEPLADQEPSANKQPSANKKQYELNIGALKPDDKETILIDKVDQLINDKLINDKPLSEQEPLSNDEEPLADKYATQTNTALILPGASKRSLGKRVSRWFFNTVLLLIVCALIVALVYQFWFKQMLVLKDDSNINHMINQSIALSNQQLSKFDLQLPQRQNLKELTLLSADLEAHPSRASTILLRISLINRADITQPLPWLEISLLNVEGNTIARRSLNPDFYLHNNKSDNQIRSNELKRITIELLSFPKQATGYELKIIDK